MQLELPAGGGAWDVTGLRASSKRLWDGGHLQVDLQGDRVGWRADWLELKDLSVAARLGWDGEHLEVNGVEISTANGLELSGDGALTIRGADHLSSYNFTGGATVPVGLLEKLALLPAGIAPTRAVSWRGEIEGVGDAWTVRGELDAGEVAAFSLPLKQARAVDFSFAPSGPLAATVSAITLDGRVEGRLDGDRDASGWSVGGEMTVADLDLGKIPPAWPWVSSLPPLGSRLSGRLAGRVPLDHPEAAGLQATLDLSGDARGRPGAGFLAPSGRFQVELEGGVLHLKEAHLAEDEMEVSASGQARLDGVLDITAAAATRDLAATVSRLERFLPVAPPALGGSLTASGSLTGTWRDPSLETRLQGDGIILAGFPLGRLAARLTWTQDGLRLEEATLSGPAADLSFHGAWPGAGGGVAAGTAPLTMEAELERIDLSVLGRLAGQADLASGELHGAGELTWSKGAPRVRVALSGERLLVAGRPLDGMRLQAVLDDRALHVESFRVWRSEGLLEAQGVLPLESAPLESDLAPSLSFSVDDFPLADQWPGVALGGRLSAAGEISLSLADPWPRGRVTMALNDLLVEGWPLPDLTATVEMDGDQNRVTVVSPEAGVDLAGWLSRESGYPWSLEGALDDIQVALPGEMGLTLGSGRTTLSAEGRLFDLDSLRGTLSFHGLALDTPAGPLAAQGALTVTATGRDLQLAPVTLRFGKEEVEILGDCVLAEVPRYTVQVVGLSDLANWAFLTGDGVEMAGTAVLDVRLEGAGRDHDLFGDLVVRGGRLRLPRIFPNALDQIEARARLEGEKVVLESLDGRLGGGRLSATGELELSGWRPGRFKLNLRSERVASRYPRAVRSITDTELELSGTPGNALLTGRVEVRRAKYEQDFKVEKSLQSRTPPSLPPPPGPLDSVRLDLDLVAPGQIWVENDFARAEFRADLHVGGTASRPVVEGHVDLVRRGRLTFRDVDYQIDEANLAFSPSFPNDPEMNILARTDVSTYTVSLQATGRLSQPRIQLSSEPDLAQDEIVLLLLTGSLPGGTQQVRISSDVMAGYLGGALFPSDALKRFTSIDHARIDPVFVEGQGDPTARLTLTERISDRLTASWSTTLGGVQGNTAELRYRVLPHLELRTAQEETGASVVEGRYVRSLPTWSQRKYRRKNRSDAQDAATRRLGTTVLLGTITLEGVPSPPGADALLAAMGLEAGAGIESGDILQAAAAAREFLVEEGYRMARVDCLGTDGPSTQPVPVNCLVEAGPLIELRLDGVRRKKDVKALTREIQEEWMEVLGREELPDAAARAAVAWYLERGHAGATATAAFVDGQDGAQVIQVDLAPGPRVRVDKVVLEGAGLLDEKMLRGHLLTTGRVTLRHVLVTPEVVEQDRDTLLRLFSGSGYLDVQVESPDLVFNATDKATVIFRIDSGRQRSIERVIFSGVSAFPVEDLEDRFAPAPGSPPDPARLEAAAAGLQRYYDSHGYADAGVVWRLERSAGGAVVKFDIRENEQIRVGQVVIQGLEVTREKIVRREVALAPGDLLMRASMQDMQRRIRDLDLFRSVVVVSLDVPGEAHTRDVLVQVKERDNLDLAAGLGFDNEEGVRASFSLGNRNFLGKGGAISFQGRISGDIKSGAVRNGWRRIGGSRNDFLGAVSLSRQDREGFGEEREALVLQLARPWSAATSIQMRYRIENFNLFDVETFSTTTPLNSLEAALLAEGRLGSLGASVVRKTFDVPSLPRDGAIRTMDLSVYSEALGSDFEYVRFFVKQGKVWSFAGDDLAYLVAANIGLMWPFGATEVVPLAERFFAGGISSVRGYQQDRLGPFNPTTLEPVGGESLFVLNNELRFHLTSNISARLFVDAGNVFLQAEDFDLGDLKYAAGPGLSYDTPVGPLRIYYGFKLNKEEEESRGRFHLTFGAIF
ncbi:MAG: translocation/assembly module TamB domain-containing protein [Acidobacteria bacterium]|nr:translocation/assembly module TamB domain-containing protein [Acidobacteriota bacterium]